MTAARLKDILYYSAVETPLLPPYVLVLRRGRDRGRRMPWKVSDTVCGFAGVRRIGKDDRVEEWVRSDGEARAARERRGVNHDFGGILARNGMRFPPSSPLLRSCVRSFVRCNASFSSFLSCLPFLRSCPPSLRLRLTPIF